MYGFWDMECNRQNFFSFWTIFTLLPPPPPAPSQPLKIKISKKWKKNTWRYHHSTHLHHKWISLDVWFLRYGAQLTELFLILGHFLPFYPTNNRKNQNFEKTKKMPGDTSFYTSAPKIMIIYYTVPEIWHLTDVIVIFHIGQFFAILPP